MHALSVFCSLYQVTVACMESICKVYGETIDIVSAIKEIDTVIATLQNVRNNIDTYHSEWFSTVEKMCDAVGTEPSLPRRCGRQTHRSNVMFSMLVDIPSLFLYLTTYSLR